MVSPVLSIYNLAGARIYGGRTGLCIHCIQLFPSPKCWEGKAVHRDKGKGNISLCLSSPSLVFARPGYWHQVWCVHSKDIGCGMLTVGLLVSLNSFCFHHRSTSSLPLGWLFFPLPANLFICMTLMTNRKTESVECTKLRHLSNGVDPKFVRGTGGGDYSSVTGWRVSRTAAQR